MGAERCCAEIRSRGGFRWKFWVPGGFLGLGCGFNCDFDCDFYRDFNCDFSGELTPCLVYPNAVSLIQGPAGTAEEASVRSPANSESICADESSLSDEHATMPVKQTKAKDAGAVIRNMSVSNGDWQ